MKSQIYGILGIMYAIAIGILIIIAVVGTSKQFSYQSSAPMYKLKLYSLSITFQKLSNMYNQERAYSVERGVFFTLAYGGYTPHDVDVPVANSTICGCKIGTPDKTTGMCVNSNGQVIYKPTCYVNREGKVIDVTSLPKQYSSAFPEKKVVYWVNGTNVNIPSQNYLLGSIKYDISTFFSVPDPVLQAPLYIMGSSFANTRFNVNLKIEGDKIIADWIPIGVKHLVIAYPNPENPTLYYTFNLHAKNTVKINFLSVFNVAKYFANNYNKVFDNARESPIPTVVDQAFVYSYYSDATQQGEYCNYSISETPFDNQSCSSENVQHHYLGPVDALYYYYYKSDKLNLESRGACASSYCEYSNVFDESSDDNPHCIAEVNSTLDNGMVKLTIVKFYDCSAEGDFTTDHLKCLMCSIVSNLNTKLNNLYSSGSISVKALPIGTFNFSLSNVTSNNEIFSVDKYEKRFTFDYCASSLESDNYKVVADSLCEEKGFNKHVGITPSSNSNCYTFSNKIIAGPNITSHTIANKIDCGGTSWHVLPFNVSVSGIGGSVIKLYSPSGLGNQLYSRINLAPYRYLCYLETGSTSISKVELTTGIGSQVKSVNIVANLSHNYNAGSSVYMITCTDGNSVVNESTGFNWNAWYEGQEGSSTNFTKLSGGLQMVNLFCKVRAGLDSTPTRLYYKYINSDRYAPMLNYTLGEARNGLIVSKIYCGRNSFSLSNSYNRVNGNKPLFVSSNVFPRELVQIYTPNYYSNQSEIFNRLCSTEYSVNVISSSSDLPANMLWDIGNKSTLIQGSGAVVTCEMS